MDMGASSIFSNTPTNNEKDFSKKTCQYLMRMNRHPLPPPPLKPSYCAICMEDKPIEKN